MPAPKVNGVRGDDGKNKTEPNNQNELNLALRSAPFRNRMTQGAEAEVDRGKRISMLDPWHLW